MSENALMTNPWVESDFDALHKEFHDRVRSHLRCFVNETEAEDLAQEVFLKVHQKLPEFRGESKLSTWIFQIATYAALDRLRSPAHRFAARHGIVDELSESWAFHIDSGHGEEPVREEMSQCIRDIVQTLSPEYSAVLLLAEMQELSLAEIALMLNCTTGAVKIRLHRARKALRQRMDQACTIYLDQDAEIQCDRKLKP
jgi:RNA polymerase sigma-70 factor (ECF subfamily)